MKRFMICVMIAAVLLLPEAVDGQSVTLVTLLNGLVAYWKLDEVSGVRYDAYADHDLTDVNTVAYQSGVIGNAASFDVSNFERLSHADVDDLSFDSMTISAWVRARADPTYGTVISKFHPTGENREYALRYYGSTNRYSFLVSSDGTSGGFSDLNHTTAVVTNTWYHVIVWYDADRDVQGIALNGVEITKTHGDGIYNGGTAELLVGGIQSAAQWTGEIDELGVWNRALIEDERAALYNDGAGLSYDQFALFPVPAALDQEHNVNELWSGNWFAGFGSIIVQIIGLALALVIAQRIIGLFWRVSWTL